MSITPTNNLVKLAIGAGHATRVELADQLYYPVAVDLLNPAQPMNGGYVGNRSGQATRLTAGGAAGNTGGYGADYSSLSGDPVAVVKTMTSDGPIYTVKRYDGRGDVTVEDPRLGSTGGAYDYTTVARYIIKADGYIYDLLQLTDQDTPITDPNSAGFAGPYQHWELATDVQNGTGTYTSTTNLYQPSLTNAQITEDHYLRKVGQISFRDKQGASQGAIQEQLTRVQNTLDTMSRMLRSLHDEAKGPFANMVIR